MPKILTLLLLFALSLTGHASDAPSPALDVLTQWIDAFNSSDAARLDTFWGKYGQPKAEPRTADDLRLRQMTGGMKLLKVTQNTGSHLVALMQEGRGNYAEATLDLASTDPPVLQGLSLHPTLPPTEESGPKAVDDQDLVKIVFKHASELAAKNEFSGAILIARNGKALLDQAWNLANIQSQEKNTTDTQFNLGSMNKMFTAVAVLQLVQQGKLSLDGTLATYWPGYPNRDLAKRVTIRELLSHTGGTGDIFTPEYEAHRTETRTLPDYVKLFGGRGVAFEPGTRMEYSNYGFILLGRLIEIVSGESYDSYVQKHIFIPAGMKHSDAWPETDHVPGRAIGYTNEPDGLQPNTSSLPWSGTSAGGGYSTTGDLLHFANALQNGKLIDPALLAEASRDQTHSPTSRKYGFGFYVSKDGEYGHGGGAPGINGELRILPAYGYVLIILTNRDPQATVMLNYISAKLPGAGVVAPSK